MQALNMLVGWVPFAKTLGAAPLLKAANMRAIARLVGISKGDVLLSNYTNVAKGVRLPACTPIFPAAWPRGSLRCHNAEIQSHAHRLPDFLSGLPCAV